jgi:hypothetical protein
MNLRSATFRTVFVFAFLLLSIGVLRAGPPGNTVAQGAWNLTYTADQGKGAAMDFHVVIHDDLNIHVETATVASKQSGPNNFGPTNGTVTGNNTHDVTIDFNFPHPLTTGHAADFVVKTTQSLKNKEEVTAAYFTDATHTKSNRPGTMGATGFTYKDPPASDLFFVTYDNNPDWLPTVWIHDLQFMINQPQHDLTDLSFFTPNYTPPESTAPFPLTQGSISSAFTVSGFTLGTYIYTQAIYADSPDLASATVIGTVTTGHQTDVPEPNSAACLLIGITLLCIFSTRKRLQRRRESS